MPNSAPGFAAHPDHRVDLVPETRRVKVAFAAVTIADSRAALRVEETDHRPVHYLPEKDVRLDLMRPTEHHTRCPYKGEASYWTIEVPAEGGAVQRSENAVWAYPSPYDEVKELAGYYAFYTSRVEFDRAQLIAALNMHSAQNWEIRKPGVISRGGIVAAQNATAAQIGAEMLAAGGTTVDAVVATAFALAAVEPWNSGLGGIGVMVVQPAGAERAKVVDFGPISSRHLDPAAYPLTGDMRTELFTWAQVAGDRNMHGSLSFVIPSAVRGYALAVERFGRMPWRDLLSPAIRLARSGLPVDWFTTIKVAAAAADLRRYDESRRVWMPDGLPPVPSLEAENPRLSLGRLPDTLERLAEAGPDDFYQGEIARSIAADVRAAEGVLSAEDLAGCRARIVPGLEIPYRGTRFQAAPKMTAGPTLARVLEQLAERRFADAPDAEFFEAMIEALRNAYVERLRGTGDVEACLATSTTHITAVDREGGIAALSTTLLSSFGSRYVLSGTGILMNNGVMWFDPQPGRPNSIGPGKRALTNMCPVIVARDRQPWFGIGASGGRRILAAVLQLASFIVDFGMDPETAAHHPRIDVSGGDRIGLDARLPASIIARLMAQPGATLVEHTVFPARFACPNLVLRDRDGKNHGISDVMSPWSAAAAESR